MRRKESDADRENRSDRGRQRDTEQESSSPTSEADSVAWLHRAVGNQAVQRFHQNSPSGSDHTLSEPRSEHEREAERIAPLMMNSTGPSRIVDGDVSSDVSRSIDWAGSSGQVLVIQRQITGTGTGNQIDAGTETEADTGREDGTGSDAVAANTAGVLINGGGRTTGTVDQIVDEVGGLGPWWPGYNPGIPEAEIDKVVSEEISRVLSDYQHIEVSIYGSLANTIGWGRVTIDPVYYINSGGGRDINVNASNTTSGIETVAGGERTKVQAVETGKATPRDIEGIVQRAINQGVVRNHVGLADDESLEQEHVQQWVNDREVGVDCSGLVVAALISSTEALNAEYGDTEGFDPYWEPERRTRGAAHLATENPGEGWPGADEVSDPEDLRPGDVWFLPADEMIGASEDHIRIVQSVEKLDADEEGGSTYEIETAESASSMGGPTGNTWRTASHDDFHPITHVGGNAPVVGSFFRSEVLQDQNDTNNSG